jgi:hypothetical protein
MRIDPWLRGTLLLLVALPIAGCGRQAPQANNVEDAIANQEIDPGSATSNEAFGAENAPAPTSEPRPQAGDPGNFGEPINLAGPRPGR